MRNTLLIILFLTIKIVAQTDLNLGDIAFTGYQSESGDRFAFVLLTDIEGGTEITFTDQGWMSSGGFYPDEPENTIYWNSTSSMEYGTQIVIQTIKNSDATEVLSSSHGNVSGDTFGLSDSGDQIFAYQGSKPTSSDQSNFLAAIQMNGEWNSEVTSSKKSTKPSVFTDGVNSLFIVDSDGSEFDNAVYDCSIKTGDANALRSAVNNPANWIKSNNLVSSPISIPHCSGPLPVELNIFNAKISENRVVLNWETATEINNYGFEIQRSKEPNKEDWKKISFINGHGNSNSVKHYSYLDNNVVFGLYFYRLKQIDIDGQYEYSEVINVDLGSPADFKLFQNYPNPFNPSTIITYQISEKTDVILSVYNDLGEKIAVLIDEEQLPNYYSVEFNATKLISGIYFYHLVTSNNIQTKKMILIK